MPDVSSGGLPRPLTSFIGRERELAQARRLLAGSYLVTLTGPGGSGKTRLCIALAAEVAGDYPDGVYFVPLAPVRDPDLVPSTIAQSLGLQDARDRPLMDHLVSQLNERQVLLVLDNFEHLLAGVPAVARLFRETSALRVLVSSRSSLRISGEQERPVPPLAVPDPGASPAPEALVVPEGSSLTALDGLAPYRDDLVVVTAHDAGPVMLVRPDGHVAARGRPGRMHPVTGYLRGLFGEPGSIPAARPGPDVHALALRPEQDQQLGGLRSVAAEPVRDAGVELGGFARLHDKVVLGEPQP